MAPLVRLRVVALGAACATVAWAIHRYRRRRSQEAEGKDRREPSTTDTDTSPRVSDDSLSLSDSQPTALASVATEPDAPEQHSQSTAAVTAAVALLAVCTTAAASWALSLLVAVALCAVLLPWRCLRRPFSPGEPPLESHANSALRAESRLPAKGTTYNAARALLKLSLDSDFTVSVLNNEVEWAFKVESDSVVLAWEREVPEADLLKVLVAELEWDLRVGTPLDPTSRQARELEPDTAKANPFTSTWHVLSDKPDGTKEDLVAQMLCFDCLAEPQGGICCVISPSPGGASLPAVLKGHQRPATDSFLWTVMLTPRGRPRRSKGFHIKGVCRLAGFSRTALRIGASMPAWLMKKMMKAEAEKAASVDELLRFLESKEGELDERMRSSRRAPLYEHFRSQLKGEVKF